MNKFSEVSKRHRGTLDTRLQSIVNEAIKVMDFSIICGYRNEADQKKAYHAGRSKKHWPDSSHNEMPSEGVDLAPWNGGIDWNDIKSFHLLAGIVMGIAHSKGIKIIWGGTFSFGDYGHFQLA